VEQLLALYLFAFGSYASDLAPFQGTWSLEIYRRSPPELTRLGALGLEDSAQGLNPISAKIILMRLDGRMALVPEGQPDSSQVRSAWNRKENAPSQRDD
jgi:hypothetical protein